jgi:hypothetical protein
MDAGLLRPADSNYCSSDFARINLEQLCGREMEAIC